MRRLSLLALCLTILWCPRLTAQDSATVVSSVEGSAASPPASMTNFAEQSVQPATRPAIEQVEPSLYYVRDKNGKLVPMFGFQFEDFMRAFKQLHGLEQGEGPPPYVIERMAAEGEVKGKTAELSIRFSVRLQKAGPLRVPLGLHDTAIRRIGEIIDVRKNSELTGLRFSRKNRDPVGHPSVTANAEISKGKPGRIVLAYDDSDGYVAWLIGEPQQLQEVSLVVIVPLTVLGSETSLRLQAPPATISELRLTVPRSDLHGDQTVHPELQETAIQGRVSEGAILETLVAAEAQSVQFVARGLSGYFQLSWRKEASHAVQAPSVLTAVGCILARIDEHSVDTEATLELSGHGSEFESFCVRLPPGARLLATSPEEFQVVEIAGKDSAVNNSAVSKSDTTADPALATGNSSADPDRAAASWLQVHLPEKTRGPLTIHLRTRQAYGHDNAGRLLELCGFEVAGAARQWGHVALAVDDDIHVSWNRQSHLRQVEDLPDALRHEEVSAGFAYSSQPCSLQAWIVPRKTRLSVEPEHMVFVDGNAVRLESTLRYMARGKKAFLLEVDLADWEIDEVGPAATVAVDGLDVDKANILRIPLMRRSSGKFSVVLKAHRRLPAENNDLQLRFPVPRHATSSSAAVVIQPADNVELIPNEDTNVELTRQQVIGAKRLPAGYQQRPLFYRGDASKAVFTAERSVHRRRVAVDVESRAELDVKMGRILQRFSYRIAYQPLRFLRIDVPAAAAEQGNIEFEIDGSKIVAAASGDDNNKNADDGIVAMVIPLASPGRIGPLELMVRYPLDWEQLPPRASAVRELPLVMPRGAELLSNRLSIRAEPPLAVRMHDENWTVDNGLKMPQSQVSELTLSSPTTAGKAEVAVHCSGSSAPQSTLVERSWICTDLTGRRRQDRAVFRVISSQMDLDVVLPTGAESVDVEFFLNGEATRPKEVLGNRFLLALPEAVPREYLLEMRYHFTGKRAAAGRLTLELPHIGGDCWNRRLYWELILPPNEHVVLNPPNFVSEYTWGWNGFFWGHQPICNSDYLADWMGLKDDHRSDHTARLPGAATRYGMNRYVFSTFGTPTSGEYYTMGRSWLVLWASAAALIVGLLLIYVPVVRHPVAVLATGVGCLAMGLIFPDAALLTLQAASLGIALAMLAGILERHLTRRWQRTVVLQTGGSVSDTDSTQTQYHHLAPALSADFTSRDTSSANGASNSGERGASSQTSGRTAEEGEMPSGPSNTS